MKNKTVIFQGQAISESEIEKYSFPIGTSFFYSNASYNDNFSVTGIEKEPGTIYVRIAGKISGEVWIEHSTLQKEAAVGAIQNIVHPQNSSSSEAPSSSVVEKKKVTKKTSKKKLK